MRMTTTRTAMRTTPSSLAPQYQQLPRHHHQQLSQPRTYPGPSETLQLQRHLASFLHLERAAFKTDDHSIRKNVCIITSLSPSFRVSSHPRDLTPFFGGHDRLHADSHQRSSCIKEKKEKEGKKTIFTDFQVLTFSHFLPSHHNQRVRRDFNTLYILHGP